MVYKAGCKVNLETGAVLAVSAPLKFHGFKTKFTSRPRGHTIGLLAVLFCGSVSAHSQVQSQGLLAAPDLVTDRPGFTEPTNLVTPGRLQIENGFSYDWGHDGSRLFAAGSRLIRLGISKRFELRLASDGYLASFVPGEQRAARDRGMADASIGAKLGLFEETRFLPAISFLPSLSLPSGHAVFSSRGYDPQLNLSWSKDLPGEFNLGGNAIVAAITDGVSRRMERAFSLSAAHILPRGFGGYAEIFSIRPASAAARPVNVVNGGVTHLLGPNLQVDVAIGRSISGQGPRYFVAGGLVVRSPRSYFARQAKKSFENMKMLAKPQ